MPVEGLFAWEVVPLTVLERRHLIVLVEEILMFVLWILHFLDLNR
jgi:hypothetical protein